MKRSATGTVHFGVPCEVAYDYLVEPTNRPNWQSSLRAVELVDGGPVRPGLRWRDVTKPGMRPLMELTEHERPRRWTEEGTWRFVRAMLTLDFEAVPPGCAVTATFHIEMPSRLRPAGLLLTRTALPFVLADLRRAARQLS